MATPLPGSAVPWLGFLRRELAPFPGRFNPVLRTLLSSSLVIVISMTLQIPFLALSLIMVFFITQANAAVTKMVGMMFVLGVPLSTALGTLVLMFTFDYPLVRLIVCSLIFIVCMFFLRTSRFTLLFFVLGFVLIYVQSLVDIVPDPESLLRTNLWVGAATFYAIVITLLVNTVFFPVEPSVQFRRYLQGQIAMLQGRLSQLASGQPVAAISPDAVQRSILTLQKLLRFSAMRSAEYVKHEDYYVAVVVCVSRLSMASSALSPSPEDSEGVAQLIRGCNDLAVAVGQRQPFRFASEPASPASSWPLQDMQNAFGTLAADHRRPPTHKTRAQPPFLVVPDAFSNPRYLKFALKAYFATLICYVFYNSVDWPGIHTIMLTCVITSLPNLGASTQKGVLRVGGCLIGAALSLLAMVFVFPHLDSIFGMLMVSLSVVAVSAWVCAGSDQTAYAGTQIIFCFALALLEDFGPVYDLTLIRDRLIGIVLGVVVSTVIQVWVWPESEGRTLVAKLAQLLERLGTGLATSASGAGQPAPSTLTVWSEVADCEAMLTRVQLESTARLAPSRDYTRWVSGMLSACRALLLVNHALGTRDSALEESETGRSLLQASTDLGQLLSRYARQVNAGADGPLSDLGLHSLEQRLAEQGSAALSPQAQWLRAHLRDVLDRLKGLAPVHGWR